MSEILARQQAPTRHRLDVGAYYRMAEADILQPNDRVELIDGEIFDRVPIGSAHGGTSNRFNRLFSRVAAEGRALVSVQGPLRLDAWNEPQPDVMLLKLKADDYRGGHPNASDVLLLIEISETSLIHDRRTKLPVDAKFGVPEVWIIDLNGAAIEVCRDPGGDAYALQERLTSGSLTPVLVPGAAIDVAALLA